MTKPSVAFALAVMWVAALSPAFAQPKAPATPPAAITAPSQEDLANTRGQLVSLIHMSPLLMQVLETDPSILADQEYISRSNPQLAAFLTQHPEVSRNPDFYLFADLPNDRSDHLRRRTAQKPVSDEQMQLDMKRQFVNDAMNTFIFVVVLGVLFWLVRALLENRRWSRVFRQQSEIHAKLIERFASSQELIDYMNTEPGRRFLEASPIPLDAAAPERLPGGLGRVMGTFQFGIVLFMLGSGLLLLSRLQREFESPLLIFGVLALMPGAGLIISAILTWRLSARLGITPPATGTRSDINLDRQ